MADEAPPMRWQILQQRVGSWSRANFGDNRGIGPLAPLLGLAEELGEMELADDDEAWLDAVADTTIFLLDLLYRCNISVSGFPVIVKYYCEDTLPARIGEVNHVVLKRIQGIRGYDEDVKYGDELVERAAWLLASLSYHPARKARPLLELTEATFNEVVSKRDWRKPCETETGTCGWWRSALAWLTRAYRSAHARISESWSTLSGGRTETVSLPDLLRLESPRVIGPSTLLSRRSQLVSSKSG